MKGSLKGMTEKPKCAIKECDNPAFILCYVEGFDNPVFVCGNCFQNNPKVKRRVRGL